MGAPPKGEQAPPARAPGEKSEKEKMLAGEPYLASDPELYRERVTVRHLLKKFNHELDYEDTDGRLELLEQLLGGLDPENPPFIEPPFYCDYGYNISVGKSFYCNFGCTFLDCASVAIGDRVIMGPGVHIYAVNHELDPGPRNGVAGAEYTRPVVIQDDVWVGGGAIICPGVTIGRGSTIAAGAVVTADVEEYTVVGGNPARVIKRLEKPAAGEAGGQGAPGQGEHRQVLGK